MLAEGGSELCEKGILISVSFLALYHLCFTHLHFK